VIETNTQMTFCIQVQAYVHIVILMRYLVSQVCVWQTKHRNECIFVGQCNW